MSRTITKKDVAVASCNFFGSLVGLLFTHSSRLPAQSQTFTPQDNGARFECVWASFYAGATGALVFLAGWVVLAGHEVWCRYDSVGRVLPVEYCNRKVFRWQGCLARKMGWEALILRLESKSMAPPSQVRHVGVVWAFPVRPNYR